MNTSNLPPEQWRALFDKAGIDFGYRPLAARMGVDHTRVRRLLRGGGTTSATVQLAADAFGVAPSRIRELRDEATLDRQPFTLPDDAERLNDEERDVIRAVVRALLNAKDGHADATDTPAADPPAEEPRTPRPEDKKTRAGDKPAGLNPADQGGRLVNFPTRDDVLPEGIAANLGDKGAPDDESAPGEAIEPIPDDDDLP